MAMATPAAGMNAGIAGAAEGIGTLYRTQARKASPEGQAEEAQNKADLDALKRNEFGPTKSQQDALVQDSVALARQQAQAQRSESTRQRAATPTLAGTSGLADQQIAATAAKTAGETRMQVADLAAQQQAAAKREAFARVSARAAKTEADLKGVHDAAKDAYNGTEGGGGGEEDWSQMAGGKKKKAAGGMTSSISSVPMG